MKISQRNTVSMPSIQKHKYINSEHTQLNSIVDNTPKVTRFNLFRNTASTIRFAQTSCSIITTESCPISTRKQITQERLKQRMLERELLQLKSSQRVQNDTVSLLSLVPQTCNEKVLAKSITFKNPSKSVHSKQALFEKYDHLPENKLKLVFNSRILKNDEAAMELITQNIEKEMKMQTQREDTLKIKREEQRRKMQDRMDININIENKAGVCRSKSEYSLPTQVTERLQNLAKPKKIRVNHMNAIDFKGLLNQDYYEAIESYRGFQSSLNCSRNTSSRYKKEPFQFPDSLITRQGSYIHEKKLVSRPATSSFFTRVKKYEEPPKDLTEGISIKESMEDLNKFDLIYRNYKGRQGFPSIQLSEQLFS